MALEVPSYKEHVHKRVDFRCFSTTSTPSEPSQAQHTIFSSDSDDLYLRQRESLMLASVSRSNSLASPLIRA